MGKIAKEVKKKVLTPTSLTADTDNAFLNSPRLLNNKKIVTLGQKSVERPHEKDGKIYNQLSRTFYQRKKRENGTAHETTRTSVNSRTSEARPLLD